MTNSGWRGCSQDLRYSRDGMERIAKLSKRCRCGCGYTAVCWWLNDCHNYQFGRTVLHNSLMAFVGRVPQYWLDQFFKHHLLLPKPLSGVLYRVGDFYHHRARYFIFEQLVWLRIFFIIIFIFTFLTIVGPCVITKTVSNNIQDLLELFFGLSCS